MRLTINGKPEETEAATLAALVEALGKPQANVATALNGDFIPARERAATTLHEGDTVEILAPLQGG